MALPPPLSERIIAFAGKIDLGRKPVDYGGAVCGPAMAQPKVWYPNLWIEGVDQPIDLPDKGKATIEYKVTRKTTTDMDGNKRHEASLEIHSIEPMGKSVIAGKTAGSAKAVKLSALAPGMICFDRARNTDGEFSPQAEETPGPETMRAAYGVPAGASNSPGAARSTGSGQAKSAVGAVAGLGGTAAAALLLARRRKG